MSTIVSEDLNARIELPKPLPPRSISESILIGALAALIVARPLIHGDDLGHLRLTSSAGSTWFDLTAWLLLVIFSAWRVIPKRHNEHTSRVFSGNSIFLCVFVMMGSSDCYRHADTWVRWELLSLFPIYYLTRQLAVRPDDSRGLLNLFVASVVSIAAIGVIQRFGPYAGIPSTEAEFADVQPGLVGDEEFQLQLNARLCPTGLVHGTLETPESYLILLLTFLPLSLLLAKQAGPKIKILLPILVVAGIMSVFAGKIFDHHVPVSLSEGLRMLWESLPLFGRGGAGFAREAHDGSLATGSAWLTMISTTGLMFAGLLIFLIYLSVSLYRQIESILKKWPGQLSQNNASATWSPWEVIQGGISGSTRWEFYLGGIAGLLGGFIALVGQMPAEAPVWDIYKFGGFAITRGAIFLLAFGLLEKIRPEPSALLKGTSLGLAIILLSGLFSEAAGFMTILFTASLLLGIWIALKPRLPELIINSEFPLARAVIELVLIATIFGYFLIVLAAPSIQTSNAVRKARTASRFYPDIERQISLAKNPVEVANARTKAVNFLRSRIVQPLRIASENEPSNAALLLELARWERTLWKQLLHVDPAEAARLGKEILKSASKAATLDRKNIAGEQSILEALLLYRQESNSQPAERLEAFDNHLQKITTKFPELEVPYRYRMLSVLLSDKHLSGEITPIENRLLTLIRLNREEGAPHGRMTDSQLKEIVDGARAFLPNPPKELLDEWTK